MTDLTVQQWIKKLAGLRSNSDSAKLDAELLVMAACACSRAWLIAHDQDCPSAAAVEQLTSWLEPFEQGMPMAYLTGQQEFWSLPLQVNGNTLIPRPATESLVEWVLQTLPTHPLQALDLGTGSGAIALALKSERPKWQLTATDQSREALQVAATNALILQLPIECIAGSWWEAVPNRCFDCVVSNPPYVVDGDPHLSALSYEPSAALTAGKTGLDDLSMIAEGVYDHLNPGGWLVVEHGYDQQAAVENLLRRAGLIDVTGKQDLAGQDRFVVGRKE